MSRLIGYRDGFGAGWDWIVVSDESGRKRPRRWTALPLLAVMAVAAFAAFATLKDAGNTEAEGGLSGAIFTTTPDGGIVNENVRYDDKRDVYLDGGPPPNAPATAAGLPDGLYVFQVTDPPGKMLLSEDPAKCRIFRVAGGVIVQRVTPSSLPLGLTNTYSRSGAAFPCHIEDNPPHPTNPGVRGDSGRHDTNADADHYSDAGAIVEQLMPYGTTPNPGGVYKAWVTPLGIYDAKDRRSLTDQLNAVPGQLPRGQQKPQLCPDFCSGADQGFGGARDHVKTDNFKVKEFFPPEIKVRKFHDINGNGVWDSGEPEIGVDQCVLADGTIANCPPGPGGGWPYNFTEPVDGGTVTNGFYTPQTHVAGTAGTYTACEARLSGWTQSAAYLDGVLHDADQCVPVIVQGASGERHEIIFGNFRPPTKSGVKFEDLDGDGRAREAGEPGLANWTITLAGTDGRGNPVNLSTVTSAGGSYSFTVPPGTYTVCEVLKAGWIQSYPPGSGCYNVTLVSGQVDDDNDFGNFRPATKSGVKFEDLDGDGSAREAGEPGLPNWTITLAGTDGRANPVNLSTITSADGSYSFTVPPGAYTVCEVLKAGWTQSYPPSGCYNITLTSGQLDSDNDFGNFRPATKSGAKFQDTNGNSARDPAEPGLPNWQICLSGTTGAGAAVNHCTLTDANGRYTFTVPPGTYTVCETRQAGFVQTYPLSGAACANGTIGWSVTLRSGDDDRDNDFGNRPNEGCTPGYWKVDQHWDSWPAPWSPGGSLSAMFSGVLNPPYATHVAGLGDGATVLMGSATQVQALSFQGGDTVPEKAEILLRAAVAAVLNADSPGVNFPWTSAQVQAAVNAALASQDATTILNLANQLDRDNNGPGGCPLN